MIPSLIALPKIYEAYVEEKVAAIIQITTIINNPVYGFKYESISLILVLMFFGLTNFPLEGGILFSSFHLRVINFFIYLIIF